MNWKISRKSLCRARGIATFLLLAIWKRDMMTRFCFGSHLRLQRCAKNGKASWQRGAHHDHQDANSGLPLSRFVTLGFFMLQQHSSIQPSLKDTATRSLVLCPFPPSLFPLLLIDAVLQEHWMLDSLVDHIISALLPLKQSYQWPLHSPHLNSDQWFNSHYSHQVFVKIRS